MFTLLPIKGQNSLFQSASSSLFLLRRVACDVRGGNREFACRLHSKCSLLHSRVLGCHAMLPKNGCEGDYTKILKRALLQISCMRCKNLELDDSLLFCKLSSSIVIHTTASITSGIEKDIFEKATYPIYPPKGERGLVVGCWTCNPEVPG